MASLKQIEANRRNAQRSTGPRTPEGKAAVCHNALATGIYAKHHVVAHTEDPKALDRLVAEYYQRFAPSTPEQRCLVDCLIADEWRLRRFLRAEGEMLTENSREITGGHLNLGESIHFASNLLELIERRIFATRKSYFATLKALGELRAAEARTESNTETPPARKAATPSNQPLAEPIGFVPPISARAFTPPRPLAAHTPETVSSQLPCEPPPSSCLLPSPMRSL